MDINESGVRFIHNHEIKQHSDEELARLQKIAANLMQLSGKLPAQRTDEWHNMRKNVISASDWGAVLDMNKYASRNSVIKGKIMEQKRFNASATMHGTKYEPCANMIYSARNNAKTYDLGLMPHPTHKFLAASPDGLVVIEDTASGKVKDICLVEIKCPASRELTGIPPAYYWAQVQGQLEVCDLERCFYLECKFKEYEKEEDYYNDQHNGDCILNEHGLEKGIVISFMDRRTNDLSYKYSKLGMRREEYQEWVANEIKKNKHVYFETSYWKLIQVNCVPIYRDREWFNNIALPKLTECWNEIIKYRGDSKAAEEFITKTSRKKKITLSEDELLITDFMNLGNKCLFSDESIKESQRTVSMFSDHIHEQKSGVPDANKCVKVANKPAPTMSMFSDHICEQKAGVQDVNKCVKVANKPAQTTSMFSDHMHEQKSGIPDSNKLKQVANKPVQTTSMFSDHIHEQKSGVLVANKCVKVANKPAQTMSMFSDHIHEQKSSVPVVNTPKKVANKPSQTTSMFSDHIHEQKSGIPGASKCVKVANKQLDAQTASMFSDHIIEIPIINTPLFSDFFNKEPDNDSQEIIAEPLFSDFYKDLDKEPHNEDLQKVERYLFS